MYSGLLPLPEQASEKTGVGRDVWVASGQRGKREALRHFLLPFCFRKMLGGRGE